MLLDLFNNGFLLDFSLESFERALERFAIFNDNKCQKKSPPYKMMGKFSEFPGDCQVFGVGKKGTVLFFPVADLAADNGVDCFGCEDLFLIDFQDVFIQDSEIRIFAYFDRA